MGREAANANAHRLFPEKIVTAQKIATKLSVISNIREIPSYHRCRACHSRQLARQTPKDTWEVSVVFRI